MLTTPSHSSGRWTKRASPIRSAAVVSNGSVLTVLRRLREGRSGGMLGTPKTAEYIKDNANIIVGHLARMSPEAAEERRALVYAEE